MRWAILAIAFLLAAYPSSASNFGVLGGGVGRVVIRGDSLSNRLGAFNSNSDDCDWCDPLEAAGLQIWNLARGGARTYDDGADCASPTYLNCEFYGERQTTRLDGACRRTLGGSGDIQEAYPDDTGLVSCVEDLPSSGQDVDVFFFGPNDIGTHTLAEWDATYEALSFAAWDVMLDASHAAKHACVVVLGPPYFRNPNNDESDAALVQMHDHLRGRVSASYPHCVVADVYSTFRAIEASRSSAILYSMYFDTCPTECIHPRFVSTADSEIRPNDMMGEIILSAVYAAHEARRLAPTVSASSSDCQFSAEFSCTF